MSKHPYMPELDLLASEENVAYEYVKDLLLRRLSSEVREALEKYMAAQRKFDEIVRLINVMEEKIKEQG